MTHGSRKRRQQKVRKYSYPKKCGYIQKQNGQPFAPRAACEVDYLVRTRVLPRNIKSRAICTSDIKSAAVLVPKRHAGTFD